MDQSSAGRFAGATAETATQGPTSQKVEGQAAPPPSEGGPWWRGIHFVALLALSLRLIVALITDHISHPDEIFQYLEQGHRLTFGYGYLPWEYRFGIRSWIIPGFASFWLSLCRLTGLDTPNFYIPLLKVVFCILSISLIYSSYVLGRALHSERAGRLAGLFVCFWFELVYYAHRPTPEILSTYLLVGALAYALKRSGPSHSLQLGALTALAAALRFTYLPAAAVIVFFVCLTRKKLEIVKAGVVFLLVIVLVGLVDYFTWGSFFASYYNNYLFNKIYDVSALFGTESARFYYLSAIARASAGILAIGALLSLLRFSRTWMPLAFIAAVILPHSLIPHKEYRFVLAVIPVLLILTAVGLSEIVSRFVAHSRQRFYYALSLLTLVGVSAIGWTGALSPDNAEGTPLYADQPILKAYRTLNRDPDLTSLLNLAAPWYRTGGYYYLHRDIPIYLPGHLKESGISSDHLAEYVSHIVCTAGTPSIPGFQTTETIGNLEIRKQRTPRIDYKKLPFDTRIILQPGIDGQFEPSVKRRF